MPNKLPCHRSLEITVQHGSASPHHVANDDEVLHAYNEAPTVNFFQQTNSQDLNVLVLGLFSSIKSFQNPNYATNIDDLVSAVADVL